MDLIITSCSARKDDTIPIPNGSKTAPPRYYLEDEELIRHLKDIRHQIFQDPRARLGTQTTYAFDLYVRAGNAYKDLREHNYEPLKSMLFLGEIEWFFLSGGYGIINALEPAKKYQATFNRNIAYQKTFPSQQICGRERFLKSAMRSFQSSTRSMFMHLGVGTTPTSSNKLTLGEIEILYKFVLKCLKALVLLVPIGFRQY